MTEVKCIACDKAIGDNPVFWDVSGGYWCESCGFKEMIDDLRSKLDRTELAEVKARMEMEASEGYLTALLKKRIHQNYDLQEENERLRGALNEISDLENFYGHDKSYYQNLLSKAIVISCKALAGESNE